MRGRIQKRQSLAKRWSVGSSSLVRQDWRGAALYPGGLVARQEWSWRRIRIDGKPGGSGDGMDDGMEGAERGC